MNKETVNSLLSAYDAVNAEVAAIEAEAKAKLAEVAAKRSALVEQIAAAASPAKKLVRNGKTLTIVSRPIKGTQRWFFRGEGTPRAPTDVLDLG